MNFRKLWPCALLLWPIASQALDLQQAYRMAKQQDPVLLAAEQRYLAVTETPAQAQALLRPQITVNAASALQYQNVDSSLSGDGSSDWLDGSVGVQGTQALYHRDYLLNLEQSQLAVDKAATDLDSIRQELILRVAVAYFDVLAAQDDLTFRQAEREADGRRLEQSKQRFDVGLIAITDVHESQASYDRSRANEIAAGNRLDNAWEALREIIGSIDEPLDVLSDELPLKTPDPEDADAWAEIAMSGNYAIKSAEKALDIAKQDIEINRAARYPVVDLVGDVRAYRASEDVRNDSETAQLGVQLNWKTYQGGRVDASIREAAYSYEAAKESLNQVKRQVNREVRDAYRGVFTSVSEVKALKAATISASSALESTQAGYDVGTRTIVDVLNVQRNLFQAKRDYAQSRYNYVLNNFRLHRAASTLREDQLEVVIKWLEPPR